MRPERAGPTQAQLALVKRLGVELPEGCDSFQAGRILDRVIMRECKRVREANPALQPGKIIMYEGEAWKILRTVQRFKFVLQRPSGGKQEFVWIINLEHCEEVIEEK